MAPQVVNTKGKKENNSAEFYTNVQKKLTELRNYVEKNAEYVGDKFVSEVRPIHLAMLAFP